MRIISIHGPEESLLTPQKYVRFIPSIAKWKESKRSVIYLVSYRVWKPETDPKTPVINPYDPGHPWVTFWKMSRFDGTAFFLLEVSKSNPENLRVLKEFPVTRNNRVDMRLFVNEQTGDIHTTFNTFGLLHPKTHAKNYKNATDTEFQPTCFLYKNKKTDKVFPNVTQKQTVKTIDANRTLTVAQKDRYKHQSWCTFQMKARLTVKGDTFVFKDSGLVCPQHHRRFEKNMQIFVNHKGKVGYQYALTPWSFFEPETCSIVGQKTTLFSKLADYFDPRPDVEAMMKNIAFSCSTPLVDFSDTEYLAVGHFKIHHGENYGYKRNLNKFLKQTKDMLGITKFDSDRLHPKLIYGMFLYTVNKKTMKLGKVSGAFVPLYKTYTQALAFPTGLSAHTKDTFLVSYHENDMTMRLLHLTRADIQRLLTFDNKSKPQEYTFNYMVL